MRELSPALVGARVVIAVSALATTAVLVQASRPTAGEDRSWWGFVPFLVWALLPYAVLAVLARGAVGPRTALLASVVVAVPVLLVLWQGFFVAPDPQSGLLVVFLPFYQLVGCGLIWLVTGVLRRRRAP